VPARRPCYDQPVGIDLFAGAGGFSLGCHQAGFHMAAAVEYDTSAAITYLVNLARPGVKIHYDTAEREEEFTRALNKHLGVTAGSRLIPGGSLAGDGWISHQPASERGCEHFWVADIRNITGQQILDALGLERGGVTIVAGGPPCQGFSAAGKHNIMDPRNSLVFEFARLVLEIRPKTFVMENVPNIVSMLTPEGVPVIDAFCRVVADGGFSEYNALKATLGAQAGTAGALRRDKPTPRRKARKRAAARRPAEPLQLSLDELEAVPP
jgi:DNA (cytosine-5)-methyltransferase 1